MSATDATDDDEDERPTWVDAEDRRLLASYRMGYRDGYRDGFKAGAEDATAESRRAFDQAVEKVSREVTDGV